MATCLVPTPPTQNKQSPGEASYVSGALLVAQVAILPFYVWLSKRTSERTSYVVGALIWMGTMLTSFLITPGSLSFAVYVFVALVEFGTGGIVVMTYGHLSQLPDVDELRTGERRAYRA